MAERAFGTQFVEQVFGAVERFLTESVLKESGPTSRDFVFREHLSIPYVIEREIQIISLCPLFLLTALTASRSRVSREFGDQVRSLWITTIQYCPQALSNSITILTSSRPAPIGKEARLKGP
jgi:hypothetical protein